MTKREQIKQAKQQGYVTAQEAAQLTGRKAGGNIHKLMVRYSVLFKRVGNAWMYYKPSIDKVPKFGSQTTARARDQFIDREVGKAGELPLGWVDAKKNETLYVCPVGKDCKRYGECPAAKPHKKNMLCDEKCPLATGTCQPIIRPKSQHPEPVKSEAELLDGVMFHHIRVEKEVGKPETVAIKLFSQSVTIFPSNLIGLAREIVRRIDGETVKRSDVQPMIDQAVKQAVESFKEKIKGALL